MLRPLSLRHISRSAGIVCAVVLATGTAIDPGVAAAKPRTPVIARGDAAFRAELALRWAPVHRQDVDSTGPHALGGTADYITRYDFDGDLNARNNWDNAGNPAYPLSAHAYYSVVETSTHWFIVYLFFHPRDWYDLFVDTEHENDAEGLLASVARDGSKFGTLRSVITVAHSDFYSYVPAGSPWRARHETIDGVLPMAAYDGSLHPVTSQQAKGHGLKVPPYYDIEGDGVVYYPSLTVAEVPSSPNDRHVSYRLVDLFEPGGLWENRENPALFANGVAFAGDASGGCGRGSLACTRNAANPPWGWNDGDDRVVRGALATDPVGLVESYFTVSELFGRAYLQNPYW
jgi:hypothetical protein